ncbi:MAG: hypothetical protein K0Q48_2414 [Bacillota bacterium]|jgi:hypothetical protein|nr:hypothetical protein [Bacillota bacterium]
MEIELLLTFGAPSFNFLCSLCSLLKKRDPVERLFVIVLFTGFILQSVRVDLFHIENQLIDVHIVFNHIIFKHELYSLFH